MKRNLDKCTTNCQNGANMTNDCQCRCSYGFSGQVDCLENYVLTVFKIKTCEQLALRSEFTDPSCGIISNSKSGVLQLR